MDIAISKECLFTEDKSSEIEELKKPNIPKITTEYGPSEKTYLCDRSRNDGPFWHFFRALLVWWRN